MKVGITGGLGFIGSNLAKGLVNSNFDVKVLDDLSTGLRNNLLGLDYEFVHGSILDERSVSKFFDDLDFVFHLAARGSVPRSFAFQKLTYDVNTLGSVSILEEARIRAIPIILISSSSVFGSANTGARSESDSKNPISPYAVSKLAMEMASQVNRINYSQDSLVIRLFNVFGPLQRSDHEYAAVIPKWISAAIKGEPLNIFGDGKQSRDFTYVNDVVEILISCLSRPEIFKIPELNVGFGCPIDLNKIIKILKKDFNDLTIKHSPSRVGDISRSLNDTTLFRSIFTDFQPTPIAEAIKGTLDWFLGDKN